MQSQADSISESESHLRQHKGTHTLTSMSLRQHLNPFSAKGHTLNHKALRHCLFLDCLGDVMHVSIYLPLLALDQWKWVIGMEDELTGKTHDASRSGRSW